MFIFWQKKPKLLIREIGLKLSWLKRSVRNVGKIKSDENNLYKRAHGDLTDTRLCGYIWNHREMENKFCCFSFIFNIISYF